MVITCAPTCRHSVADVGEVLPDLCVRCAAASQNEDHHLPDRSLLWSARVTGSGFFSFVAVVNRDRWRQRQQGHDSDNDTHSDEGTNGSLKPSSGMCS